MTKRELEPEFQTESPEPNPKPAKKVKSVTSQDASQPKKRYIVFVGNLPYTITKDDLESHFSSYEPVSVRLLTDKVTKKPRGIAFIEFASSENLEMALSLHHTDYKGRKLNVELTVGGGGNKSKANDNNAYWDEYIEKIPFDPEMQNAYYNDYKIQVKNGSFCGPYSEFVAFMKYKNSVFAQLGTAKSQDSFEVSSTYKNGFTVSPYIPSSPLATSRSFSKAPILKEPSIVPVNQQKFSPFSKRNYEDRIRDALSKIPATPLYNKIKQERQLKLDGLKKKIEESTKPKLPTLPGDASKRLSEARGRPESFTIVEIFNIPIGSKEMKKLVSPNWLNDEIINAYFEMIQARSNSDDHRNLPKVHVFSTHFYSTIMERGYEGVQRWTRKVDIFAKDLILIPVHLGMHWVLAVIDFRLKMVRYIDSLHGSNPKALNVFKMYLESEHQSKKGFPFDAADWTFESVTNCPAQRNGYDCGVFTCVNAEYISRNASLSYSQNDMLYFRDKIGYELLTQNFLE